MGRSGTSAIARVLALCGGTLPALLVDANDGNTAGHWEPLEALELNDKFLNEHDGTWFDPTLRLQEEVIVNATAKADYLRNIRTFLNASHKCPFLVVKEPRITALSAFWFEAARQTGMVIKVVIPVRHPAEASASLITRDRMSAELSYALWLKYNLLAERQSREFSRVFVEYTSLLTSWRTQVARISNTLSLDLRTTDENAIDAFLDRNLHRQKFSGPITEVFGPENF